MTSAQLEFAACALANSPYILGYNAGLCRSTQDCPFADGSAEGAAWFSGYKQGTTDAEALPKVAAALNDVHLQPLHHAQAGHISLEGLMWGLGIVIAFLLAYLVGLFAGAAGGM